MSKELVTLKTILLLTFVPVPPVPGFRYNAATPALSGAPPVPALVLSRPAPGGFPAVQGDTARPVRPASLGRCQAVQSSPTQTGYYNTSRRKIYTYINTKYRIYLI